MEPELIVVVSDNNNCSNDCLRILDHTGGSVGVDPDVTLLRKGYNARTTANISTISGIVELNEICKKNKIIQMNNSDIWVYTKFVNYFMTKGY